MFAFGGILSIVQAGGVLLMPPSPRFYVLRGKYTEASTLCRDIWRTGDLLSAVRQMATPGGFVYLFRRSFKLFWQSRAQARQPG